MANVEETASGLFRVPVGLGEGNGVVWDHPGWFAAAGLDIRDYRIVSVAFEPAKGHNPDWPSLHPAWLSVTYARADDPAVEARPPRQGLCGWQLGDPDDGPLEFALAANEFITSVGVQRWYAGVAKLGLWTSHGRCVFSGGEGAECRMDRLTPGRGFAVAGFWGRRGWSVDSLGIYLAPLRWSAAMHGAFPRDFRSQVQSLLLVYRRLQDQAKQEGQEMDQAKQQGQELDQAEQEGQEMDLGSMPKEVVLRIIEMLAKLLVVSGRNEICSVNRV